MNVLIVYYSRTGNTKRLAERLRGRFGAQSEEIRERGRDRAGFFGLIGAIWEATRELPSDIEPTAQPIETFDLILLGAPVWAGKPPPAMRAFLADNADRIRRAAFFATHGGGGAERMFLKMAKILGRAPIAALQMKERELERCGESAELGRFVETCAGAIAPRPSGTPGPAVATQLRN